MRLTILHVPDCPNVATLADRLGEVITGRGDFDVDVNRQMVDSEQAARELGMTGSPTLLVDGRDPFAEPGRAASLSCRLYRDETGRIVGAPSVAQLCHVLVESATPKSAGAVGTGQDARVERDCCATAADAADSAVSLEERRARTAPTDPAGQAVHQAILRAFANTGCAPATAELESIAAVHGATVHEVLVNLHNVDAVRLDADNQIAVAYPFSATPTRHRVRLSSGIEVWAMCAIDALGLPAMLDTDAVITSSDPANGRPVTVAVAVGRYRWDPVTAVVFLSATAGAGPSAETCCNDLNFFTTPASAQAWIDAHPPLCGEILDPASAEQRGRRIFGSLLRAGQTVMATPWSDADDERRHQRKDLAMTSTTDQIIERGLRAWTTGDLDALETVLDPAVTLKWVEPGEWDCVGRDEVMRLLRHRQHEGSAAYPVTIEHVDEHTFIVSSTPPVDYDGPQPFPVATRITVAGGKVTAMQQYRTDDPSAAGR